MRLLDKLMRWTVMAALIGGIGVTAPASARDLIVEVNGRPVYLGHRQQAYMDRGVWMIPAVPVLRAGNVWCRWDGRRGELEVAMMRGSLTLYVDSYTAYDGPRRDILSRPVAVHHGDPFVPADFLERALGMRAYYDARSHVLSFGDRPYDRWDRGRWDDNWRYRDDDRRWDRDGRRDRGFYVEPPGRRWGSAVDLRGQWGGTAVRIRVYRPNGSECINRQVGVRDGAWSASLSLSSGKYRAVLEAYDGRALAQRKEVEFVVR
ncbi:MAG: hypothetical protein GX446_05885 [Chthonomonadales bacterium]|nr:hypothetical protein [Chthonomonadales bacterium]